MGLIMGFRKGSKLFLMYGCYYTKVYWYINWQSPTNREIYFYCGYIIIRECWVSKWAQTYFLNRVCGTSRMVINLSTEYFELSKDSVTHIERGLFALVHHVCSHLSEGRSFLGITRYISICCHALKPLYIMQLRSIAPFQHFTLLH